jgi:hypothetical protein
VASADVLYVNRTAAPGNIDCTSAAPCNSITKAVTAALGTRKWIQVAADATSYQDSVDLSGTRAKEVVIKGTGATLDATPDDVPAFNLGTLVTVAANVRIEGLTITGGFDSTDADGVFCAGTAMAKPTLTLARATVRNNTGSGIEATNCTVTVTGSTVDGNDGGGVSLTSSNFDIRNNFILGNGLLTQSSGGVRLQTIAMTANPSTFAFNTMYLNQTSGAGPQSVICSAVDKVILFNGNLVWGADIARDEVTLPAVEANCVHNYSLIGPKNYASGANNVDLTGVTPTTLFQSIVDPLNLHLKAGAQAINEADPASTESFDFDGETRPKGAVRDVGADEAE